MNKKLPRTGAALLNVPYGLWSLLFIIAPMGMIAFFAFTDTSGQFSLATFRHIFDRSDIYGRAFADSLRFGFLSTGISLLLAFPLAHFMANTKPSTQRMLMMLIMVPMWMNFLIATYAWRTLLEQNGIINALLTSVNLPRLQMINTPGAALLGMVYNFLPFMILPIYSVMSRLNVSLVEAAQDLGASRLSVLRKVIVPLSMPGVLSGVIMVFVPSVSVFYISRKLGGQSVLLIGDIIADVVLDELHLGAALSLVMMAIVLICMLAMNRFADRERGAFVT